MSTDVFDRVEHHETDSEGVSIHYVTLGEGPVVLFVHGFPDFWYTWREQMDALALVEAHHEDEFPNLLGHALAVVPASTPTFIVSTRPIDWDAFGKAAAERDAELAGRKLQDINVAGNELSRHFQP